MTTAVNVSSMSQCRLIVIIHKPTMKDCSAMNIRSKVNFLLCLPLIEKSRAFFVGEMCIEIQIERLDFPQPQQSLINSGNLQEAGEVLETEEENNLLQEIFCFSKNRGKIYRQEFV